MRWSAFHLSGILLLIGVSAHILAAEIDSERAADLKAVWLARIPEYAAWPDTDNRRSSTAPVRIGVLGRGQYTPRITPDGTSGVDSIRIALLDHVFQQHVLTIATIAAGAAGDRRQRNTIR